MMQEIARALLWIPLTIYLLANIPQVVKNYKRKSLHGISLTMLVMFYTGVAFSLPYIYFLNLPLAYKVLIPIQAMFMITIAGQAYYYSHSNYQKNIILKLYGVSSFLALSLSCAGFYYPYQAGSLAGWILAILLSTNQIPQIIKMWRSKKIGSYSLGHVSLSTSAALTELTIAFILGLPIQSILNTSRNLFFRFIQLYQFWRYR